MSINVEAIVRISGNVVAGSSVSIKDIAGLTVSSGTTNSFGIVDLSVPGTGTYVISASYQTGGESYSDSKTFTPESTGTTFIELNLQKV